MIELNFSQCQINEATTPKGLFNTKKYFLLSNGYSIELCAGANPFSGIAVNANSPEAKTFAWEWFTVEAGGRATKLQEAGDLQLVIIQVGGVQEVTGVTFLTDVSLRFTSFERSMSQHSSGKPIDSYQPEFRMKVKAGSHVQFPVLIDGVVSLAPAETDTPCT